MPLGMCVHAFVSILYMCIYSSSAFNLKKSERVCVIIYYYKSSRCVWMWMHVFIHVCMHIEMVKF